MTDSYYDLGEFGRTITTSSQEAQLWFNRGLTWCYGFHHEEAARCFQNGIDADAPAAMNHWGLAYALGPNYNKGWDFFAEEELADTLSAISDAADAARDRSAGASNVERALIQTLAARYQPEHEAETDAWNDDYATAMRSVYETYPDDLDVIALFAEALMNRTPWGLWDLTTGEPADGANTLEARAVLEHAMALPGGLEHPGVLHFYIHLLEMSPTPEQALPAADALRDLIPDSGHLQHMPTHIDVLCGYYAKVVEDNNKAIAADRKALERDGPLNFYTLYRCHDYHFKLYGAMFAGQQSAALDAATEMEQLLSPEVLAIPVPPMADWVEGFVPMRMHVLIRFGRWDEIIATPLPKDAALYCATTATMRYARGVAFAVTDRIEKARQEAEAFEAAYQAVPDSRYLFNNTCQDILAIAREMLHGELEYRAGNIDEGFARLRRAVELDDALPYDEPWGWMQPSRHALGALLLEQDRVAEATEVYAADLGFGGDLPRACQHPENVWSLHGYHECLVKLGRDAEAKLVRQRLDLARARAEVPIESSCFCRRTGT